MSEQQKSVRPKQNFTDEKRIMLYGAERFRKFMRDIETQFA